MNNRWGKYSKTVIAKLDGFSKQAECLPGVVIIHNVKDFSVVYMSVKGLELLAMTLKELQEMRTDYYDRFFNIEDHSDFIPKIAKLINEKDPDANFSYFQQVKLAGKPDWVWHLTCTRIFAFDEQNEPLLIVSIAIQVQEMKHIPKKAERLQNENLFLKQNVHRFSTLGPREKEVLKWVALGLISNEIAEKMFISVETVNTHRKNIKRKLEISTNYDFMEYARSFDLI